MSSVLSAADIDAIRTSGSSDADLLYNGVLSFQRPSEELERQVATNPSAVTAAVPGMLQRLMVVHRQIATELYKLQQAESNAAATQQMLEEMLRQAQAATVPVFNMDLAANGGRMMPTPHGYRPVPVMKSNGQWEWGDHSTNGVGSGSACKLY